jgi:hypothetical protein
VAYKTVCQLYNDRLSLSKPKLLDLTNGYLLDSSQEEEAARLVAKGYVRWEPEPVAPEPEHAPVKRRPGRPRTKGI